jgi:xanthosine utilization system XapX-like protein
VLIYLVAIAGICVGIVYNLIKFYQEIRETMDKTDMEID